METTAPTTEKKKKKPSSVRHTRAIQRDRSKRPTVAPPAAEVEARLTELIHPATYAQVAAYQAHGLRARILTLPVMVAFVLSLIWRQMGSVREAVRVLQTEGHLWTGPLQVSPQAVGQRLRTIPADLFQRVLLDLLPRLHERHAQRERPLPPAVRWAQQHFTAVAALDGSTLDTLLRKVGLLQEAAVVLAGRMATLLDVGSRLPRQVWYEEDSAAHDQRFWARLLASLTPGMLLLFDLGFFNYPHFDDLTGRHVSFITRATKNMAFKVERVLQTSSVLRDWVVWAGASAESRCRAPLRLAEVRYQGKWYRYLTNVLDPTVLPAEYVIALYWQRWRIEDAFAAVKRLLGLAYFWAGSQNGVQVQVWATWLLYAVLVDLTDEVAERLQQPVAALSLEMVYRGLYHFTQAFHRKEADDPITYLATHAKRLGILKQRRPTRTSPTALLHLTVAQKA
jgi:hypothetical protein